MFSRFLRRKRNRLVFCAPTKQFCTGQDARKWLSKTMGTTPEQAEGILKGLKAGGLGPSEWIGVLKSMGPQGRAALLQAVDREQEEDAKRAGMEEVTLAVEIPKERFSTHFQMRAGDTLFDLMRNDEDFARYLECACEGKMACSTCHVIIDPESFDKLPPPSEEELDMLDLAFQPQRTSRLGCQIKMAKEVDGMKVTIPDEAHNMYN